MRLIGYLFVFSALSYNLWKDWASHPNPFIQDVEQYYSYLIAFFIKHSPGFGFPNSYWLMPTPLGFYVPKMSIGLSYLYLPFFFIAHILTWIQGGEMNGYSSIYAYGIYYGGILYVFGGLLVLRLILLRYFNEFITTLTIASIYLGTNLFYYTLGTSLMSHSFLFTIIILILYGTINWYESGKNKYLFWIAFLCGLTSIIRPTNLIVVLIPVLFGIQYFNNRKILFEFYKKRLLLIVPVILLFLLPWLPQMAYWKWYTGSFLFYSYVGETFHFDSPELVNCLFSYRKGWLIYTPIMVFSVLGSVLLFKRIPNLFLSITIVCAGIFYINSSWWCWWWGGSFGNRGMIEFYGLLAFPMACSYEFLSRKIKKGWFIALVSLFIVYNLYQDYRFKATVLHWDSTTKESFWWGFFKLSITAEEKAEREKMLIPPDESRKSK